MKTKTLFVVILAAMIFISCAPVVKPSPIENPLPTAKPTPTMLLPGVTPTLIQVPQVTNWKTYTSENFGVSLNYPEYWELDNSGAAVYSGPDGFFQITAAGSAGPNARVLCENYTQRPLSWKLMDYGSNPSMEILQVDGKPACLILPSADQSQEKREKSLLVVEYPKSGQERTRLLIFFADKNHMRDFSNTLKFVPVSFTATPSPEVKPEPAAANTIMPSPSATFMSNASQTKKGVTLTVTNVNPSKSKTIVTFVVRVDPQWGLDVDTFPPQQALYDHSILFDKAGKSYGPISGTYGLPQLDSETGGVKFENTLTFASLESGTGMFQTEITITNIPVRQPVSVTLSNHSELDDWSIHPGITFSSFTDLPGDVRILSQSGSIVKLEFTFNRAKVGGLQLGCLYFYPENQDKMKGYKDCLIHDQQTISKVEVDIPTNKEMPILMNVSASVMFTEPFVVPWSVIK